MQNEVAALGWIVPQGVFSCLGKRRRFFGRGRFSIVMARPAGVDDGFRVEARGEALSFIQTEKEPRRWSTLGGSRPLKKGTTISDEANYGAE